MGSLDLQNLDGVIAELDNKSPATRSPKQQDAVLAFSRRTSAAPDTRLLMDDAVSLLTEMLEADLGGVGEVDAEGRSLALAVAAKDRASGPIVHSCRLDSIDSVAALSLNRACPVSIANLAAATRFTDRFLLDQGVVGALAVPLHLNARPYGVLGVFTRHERRFDSDDIGFAETIAHLLTSSIARATAETALFEQRQVHSTVLEMVDALVLTLDAEGHVVDMNRLSQELTRYSPEEMRDRPFWEMLAAPEESELIRGIFHGTRKGPTPNEFELRLRTKDGQERRVSWSLKALANGQVQTVILTGTDQTAHRQTEEELEKATSLAQRAIEAIKELRGAAGAAEPAPADPARNDAWPSDTAGRADSPPSREARASQSDGDAVPASFAPEAQGQAGSPEKRSSLRRAYRYHQWIAPFDLTAIPRPKDFFSVECSDISAGGVSFFLDRAPTFHNLVIALGCAPSLTHFTARVVRVAGCERDGQMRYLVGCRFTGRVYL